jgi:hypothetical protein
MSGRQIMGSRACHAKQQGLQKLKAAKAARDQRKRQAAEAAARLAAGANTDI